jgi:hypothetical protein
MLNEIRSILVEHGYEVARASNAVLAIRDPGSGVAVRAALEGEVLFFTVPCVTLPDTAISSDLMRRMLAADNGISTSSFQLYPGTPGHTLVTLSNFCKLQNLGNDDVDDMLSCVDFLLADILQARQLFSELSITPTDSDSAVAK